MGDLTLSHPRIDGAVAFVADDSAPVKGLYLLDAGITGVSLSRDHQLVGVAIV